MCDLYAQTQDWTLSKPCKTHNSQRNSRTQKTKKEHDEERKLYCIALNVLDELWITSTKASYLYASTSRFKNLDLYTFFRWTARISLTKVDS